MYCHEKDNKSDRRKMLTVDFDVNIASISLDKPMDFHG
jgi:hypothetical protein